MPEETVAAGPVTRTNIGRLTNGIFGFSFLLLFISLPNAGFNAGTTVADSYGLIQGPGILNFLMVFLILAMIWTGMFHIFHQTARIDHLFLYLHFILLMLVIVIPVTNGLANLPREDVLFPVLFNLNILAIGLVLILEWRHCRNKPALLKPGVQKDMAPFIRTGLLIIPLTAVAGCVLAGFSVPDTQYLYVVAVSAFIITAAWMSEYRRKNPAVMVIVPGVQSAGGKIQETCGAEGAVPQEMIEMLINTIFAFALTLVVKTNLRIPVVNSPESVTFLATLNLENMMTNGINFLFIFMILMVIYILFFEIMHFTRINNWIVICFSFEFILSILFIPLTSLLWAISDRTDIYAIIVHVNIIFSGLLMIILWRYISTDPWLRLPGTDPSKVSSLSLRLLLLPLTAVAGLVLDSWEWTFRAIPFPSLYFVPVALFVYLSRDEEVPEQPEPDET